MIELDVRGNEEVVAVIRKALEPFASEPVRIYQHGGFAGEAGVFGAVTSVAVAVFPKIVEILKPLVAKDRNLKISANGVDLMVQDLGEAEEVLDLLSERGLLAKGDNDGPRGA